MALLVASIGQPKEDAARGGLDTAEQHDIRLGKAHRGRLCRVKIGQHPFFGLCEPFRDGHAKKCSAPALDQQAGDAVGRVGRAGEHGQHFFVLRRL